MIRQDDPRQSRQLGRHEPESALPTWTSIWIDAESDGFHGRLLAIALVTESGATFEGVLPLMHLVDPWTIKHVVPVLGTPTHMDDISLSEDLAAWLRQFDGAEIVADWHRDLVHFFGLLGPRPGVQLATCPIRASLRPWLNGADGDASAGPFHKPKADAVRLMHADLSHQANGHRRSGSA